jgi:hypothetical protein
MGGIRKMSHVLSGYTAAPDFGPALSAVGTTQGGPTPVLVTEQEIAFSTAAAISAPATVRRRWLGATLTAAIGGILTLPEPRPHYPRREPSHFEAARMSRQMDHL